MPDRKATEVLAELEAEIKKISKLIENQTFQITLILNKLNNTVDLNQTTINTQALNKSQSDIPGLKPGVRLMDGVLMSPENSETNVESFDFTDADMLTKPVPVIHKILYGDGSAVFNATVEVYNSNGEKVKTAKTHNGKWSSQLNPGNYTINIFKAATNVKHEIKTTLNVTVPNSSKVVDLGEYKEKL